LASRQAASFFGWISQRFPPRLAARSVRSVIVDDSYISASTLELPAAEPVLRLTFTSKLEGCPTALLRCL
jgi:hypothetical protein